MGNLAFQVRSTVLFQGFGGGGAEFRDWVVGVVGIRALSVKTPDNHLIFRALKA